MENPSYRRQAEYPEEARDFSGDAPNARYRQGHGTMKDAQQILRHASIKTTADVYMQEIQASVRAAINSRTRAIFNQRNRDSSQLDNPVFYQRRPNSLKPPNTTVPNGSKFTSRAGVSV